MSFLSFGGYRGFPPIAGVHKEALPPYCCLQDSYREAAKQV